MKEMLTLILRRAQAVHLVRAVRRSSGPRIAISRNEICENFGAFCAGSDPERHRDSQVERSGNWIQAGSYRRYQSGSWLQAESAPLHQPAPAYCFGYGNNRVTMLSGTGNESHNIPIILELSSGGSFNQYRCSPIGLLGTK